jgi:hypothetical protein
MQAQLVSAHGMLAILEVLESKPSRDVIIRLLEIINLVHFLIALFSTINHHIAGQCGSRSPRKLLFDWASMFLCDIVKELTLYFQRDTCFDGYGLQIALFCRVLTIFRFYIKEVLIRVPPGGV